MQPPHIIKKKINDLKQIRWKYEGLVLQLQDFEMNLMSQTWMPEDQKSPPDSGPMWTSVNIYAWAWGGGH